MNLGTINRLIVTESHFWRLIVAESRTINMDSLSPTKVNEATTATFSVGLYRSSKRRNSKFKFRQTRLLAYLKQMCDCQKLVSCLDFAAKKNRRDAYSRKKEGDADRRSVIIMGCANAEMWETVFLHNSSHPPLRDGKSGLPHMLAWPTIKFYRLLKLFPIFSLNSHV